MYERRHRPLRSGPLTRSTLPLLNVVLMLTFALGGCQSRCRSGQILVGDRCRQASDFLTKDSTQPLDAGPDAKSLERPDAATTSSASDAARDEDPSVSARHSDSGALPRKADSATGDPVDAATMGNEQDGAAKANSTGQMECPEGAAPEAEVCDDTDNDCDGKVDEAPECSIGSAICGGLGTKSTCDDKGVLHQCNAPGEVVETESCKSVRHCEAGKDRGSCAICLAGTDDEYQCDGPMLMRCSDNGDSYVPAKTCSTVALCNAAAGDCTAAACAPGQSVCIGDELRKCNGDQTAFELMETCEVGLCDALAGTCDVCVPRTSRCEDRRVSLTCNADGTRIERRECSGDRPVCTGNGECVECASASDCGTNERCASGTCSCPGNPDLNTDRSNCGTCGHRCGADEDCVRGRCEEYCGGADIQRDPMNCGTACERCDTDETCNNGSCARCGDTNTDENNCGACGNRCNSETECVQGRCEMVSRCGDGRLDVEAGEQCDAGRNVSGCSSSCQITGFYGERCSTPGPTTVGGTSAICFSFGVNGQPAPPMVLPFCSPSGTCPSVPGANWQTACATSTGGPNGMCYLACNSDSDCPPEYDCHSPFCWKF